MAAKLDPLLNRIRTDDADGLGTDAPSDGKQYVRKDGAWAEVAATENLNDLTDVVIATPSTDQVLRYNGSEWVNGNAVTSSASIGIEFFPDDTAITPAGNDSTYPIKTLSKVPVTTTAEDVDSITMSNNTVLYGTYVHDTALGRTSIDAGVWSFNVYAGVSNAANITSLRQNINRARPLTGTLTTTGTGTTRTATASAGTPFAAAVIDVGGTIDSDSFLRTTTGYFRILSRVSDLEVTIATPSTYTNQAGVAASVHKRLFQVDTGEINNTATSPLFAGLQLYSIKSAQPAFTVEVNDKLATAFFGVSDGARTVYFAHNGTTRYSYFATPLITMHNNLAGLQGGTGSGVTGEFYHLTAAQHAALGGITSTVSAVTSSGNFTVPAGVTKLKHVFVVAGGGAGGGGNGACGAGGGAGGVIHLEDIFVTPADLIPAVIGAGGTCASASSDGSNGQDSSVNIDGTVHAATGGGGGSSYPNNTSGGNGGSGGGHNYAMSGSPGTGIAAVLGQIEVTEGQGHNGGEGGGGNYAGGGGGFSQVGATATAGLPGKGGDGIDLRAFVGTLIGDGGWFAGGGGGGFYSAATQAAGGEGGGGAGGTTGHQEGYAGTTNTGGGGGGASYISSAEVGGSGGSGIVIFIY